ncbi:hypothetical protein [Ferrimonas aestuarii]|uniref:Uncharacterized protein n=1 Tax=Ferrimonas aestuarii TaxID=2569539 RepID=A0A4U1BKD6_9GAMM|nr:hypothetical protein [Ferrimonas aestuarii]TKB51693.1 hypothetical protein FCL42_17800 [Ferrimonas aestuarii]
MTRHFLLASSLFELGLLEHQLKRQGFTPAQIHVISPRDALASKLRLQSWQSLIFLELAHCCIQGARIGLILALVCLVVATALGIDSSVGWTPILMFAAVLLGFSVWEGGLIGVSTPEQLQRTFHKEIRQGQHLLVVDVLEPQETLFLALINQHPLIQQVGIGNGVMPSAIRIQNWWLAH